MHLFVDPSLWKLLPKIHCYAAGSFQLKQNKHHHIVFFDASSSTANIFSFYMHIFFGLQYPFRVFPFTLAPRCVLPINFSKLKIARNWIVSLYSNISAIFHYAFSLGMCRDIRLHGIIRAVRYNEINSPTQQNISTKNRKQRKLHGNCMITNQPPSKRWNLMKKIFRQFFSRLHSPSRSHSQNEF